MRYYKKILACIGAWAMVGAACYAQATSPDELGLWRIWVSHTNAAADHASILAACQSFRTKAPTDPLIVVVQGLEAWHLLKAGKTNDAVQLLEPIAALSNDTLQKAGAEIARSWLTRLDRELVRAALKRLYLRDVEFPVFLEAIKTLKGAKLPPFTDRWNQPWSYRPTDIPTIKDTPRQRYVLESTRLGADSDLAEALAVPDASRITIEPVRVMGSGDTGETVEFTSPTRKGGVLMVGAGMEGVTFAFLGKSIIVMADQNHWRVVTRPR